MSSMEAHKGKAYPLGLTISEFLKTNPELIEDYYKDQVDKDPREVFHNGLTCGYESYIEVGNEVYKLENTQLDEFGYAVADKNADGSFNYNVMFYNGGCGLSEAIELAIKEAK